MVDANIARTGISSKTLIGAEKLQVNKFDNLVLMGLVLLLVRLSVVRTSDATELWFCDIAVAH